MCGLVGVAGNLYKKDIDAFTQLLYVDVLRGDHSTGVASANSKGDVKYIKMAGPASDLIDRKGFDNVVTMQQRMIMGHNRFGTMGARTSKNAHPFDFPTLIGAHNGTVDYASKNRMQEGASFDTDSEAIFNNIDKMGIEDTVGKLEGAWALVYYDKTDNSINFLRNDQRTLYWTYGKDGTSLYWASEYGMLSWILSRNGIDYEKINAFEPNVHVSWIVPDGSKKFEAPRNMEVLGKPKVEVFQGVSRFQSPYEKAKKEAEEKAAARASGYAALFGLAEEDEDWAEEPEKSNFEDVWIWQTEESFDEYKARTSCVPPKAFQPKPVIALPDKSSDKIIKITDIKKKNKIKNPITGSDLTRAEFDEITQEGCDWCHTPVYFEQSGVKLHCTAEGEIEAFCPKCVQTNSLVKDYLKEA